MEGGVLLGVDPGARVGGVGLVLGAQASEGLLEVGPRVAERSEGRGRVCIQGRPDRGQERVNAAADDASILPYTAHAPETNTRPWLALVNPS